MLGRARRSASRRAPGAVRVRSTASMSEPLRWPCKVRSISRLARAAGAILGEKIVINEFVAYLTLSQQFDAFSPRAQAVLTVALCGFANFSSIGILLGGLGGLIPGRVGEIAILGLRAVLAATLANLMSAAIAGLLFLG